MPLTHLPADAPTDEVANALERDGCVVLDRVLNSATIDQIRDDMAVYIEATPKGEDVFDGLETRRAGMLVARSPKSREVIMNASVLEVAARALSHASTPALCLAKEMK